jgi:hypothetical protein
VSDLLRVLQEPWLVEAMNHLTRSLDLPGLVRNIGTGIQEKVGSEIAGALIEQMIRWCKSKRSAESDETIEMSMTRVGVLYDELADDIVNLRTSGVSVGAATFRTAYNDPQGAAALTAACNAASETDDITTIRALAALLAKRLQAESGSRLALRVRQAAEATRELQLRELYAMGVLTLIASQNNLVRREPDIDGQTISGQYTDADRQQIVEWYNDSVPRAAAIHPSVSDLWELQAHGLVVQRPSAVDYEQKFAPSASAVASLWIRAGGNPQEAYPSPAMQLLDQLELGSNARGQRDFERPPLAAYQITEAGLLLGATFLEQLGIKVPFDFMGWKQREPTDAA